MNSRILLLAITLSLSILTTAQPYFQQEVNYTISVKLDDISHAISGFESLQYINNSPDTLIYLYFHLWPNAYKNNTTAFARQQIENRSTRFYYSSEEERGYMDSLNFITNNKNLQWELDAKAIDICKVFLTDPLFPGDTVVITTPFYVKIPGSFSRLGHVGQSYQITQWYPKPAVYDRNGWNQMPYLDIGEFYSEFGSYDIAITVPDQYVVAATGNLLEPGELKWLENKAKKQMLAGDEHTGAGKDSTYPGKGGVKTLHYHAEKVHDFAWFADQYYRVDKSEVILASGRKVTTWSMYPESDTLLWKNSTEYINDAVRYYSAWYGEYPYDNCSAVKGAISAGGAMEYPTITVVGKVVTATMLEEFITHEVGHNWFYGILGFNERKYPYLDEGINSFSEFRYMRTKYPDKKMYEELIGNDCLARFLNIEDLPYGCLYELQYLLPARMKLDQPMNLHSEEYTLNNYGAIVYCKSALAFTYLMEYLGEDKFNQVMQNFYEAWKYKHPEPDDLRQAFESQCKEDLSWFFDKLVPTTGIIDYKLMNIKGDSMLVKNNGEIASPLFYAGKNFGKPIYQLWNDGFMGKKWLSLPADTIRQVTLFDSIWLPEWNRKNNSSKVNGLFKGMNPVDIHLFQLLEKPDRTQIGILPAIGWNYYNKLMLGVLLYSPLLPKQTFEYQLAPMFGLGNRDLAGIGSVGVNVYPNSTLLQSLNFRLSALSFGYNEQTTGSFNRARADILMNLKKPDPQSPVRNSVRLSLVGADRMGDYTRGDYFFKMFYGIVSITHENRNVLNPYSGQLNIEMNKDYLKSYLELHYTHAFSYAKDAFQFRFFGGLFLYTSNTFSPLYSFHLSGRSGTQDYLFESVFLGRFEEIGDPNSSKTLSRQFVAGEGGFASYHSFAMSDKWLTSIGANIKIYHFPIYIYTNAGTYSGAGKIERTMGEDVIKSVTVAFEAGAMINVGNFLKIYFPFVASSDIRGVSDFYFENYWQTIRYSIDFNAINPFKIKDKLF
jgi:hypothetical protein